MSKERRSLAMSPAQMVVDGWQQSAQTTSTERYKRDLQKSRRAEQERKYNALLAQRRVERERRNRVRKLSDNELAHPFFNRKVTLII